jgi:hypothetical protein
VRVAVTVFVVLYTPTGHEGQGAGSSFVGVFSTEAKAQEFIQARAGFRVQECEVDP